MDAAYQQHAGYVRRKSQSSTSTGYFSLAPLTTKMPLTDAEDLPDFVAPPLYHSSSYLQGKSAPATPRLFQSPSQTRSNSPRRRASATDVDVVANPLTKSKSTTHLHVHKGDRQGQGGLSHVPRRRRDVGTRGGNNSDWMMRTGALISLETRESKGQAWLISRASSTSLTGMRDTDEEVYERELARERELASRRHSRRGSASGFEGGLVSPGSRLSSRSQSRTGSMAQLRSPLEHVTQTQDSQELGEDNIPGPDFVGLDEKLEALRIDTSKADEATVRRLVLSRNGVGAWMWSLFAVEENDEDSDTADGDATDCETESPIPRSVSLDFEGFSCPPESRIPPPEEKDGTVWQDAAWLLSVASKVLL